MKKLIKTIKVNYDVVEMMLFFWQSVAEKEKVSEFYMTDVAEKDEMKYFTDLNLARNLLEKCFLQYLTGNY